MRYLRILIPAILFFGSSILPAQIITYKSSTRLEEKISQNSFSIQAKSEANIQRMADQSPNPSIHHGFNSGRGEYYFKAWPNPFHHTMHIELPEGENAHSFEIFTLAGKRIRIETGLSGNHILLSRDKLPAGIYLLRINANHTYTGRIAVE